MMHTTSFALSRFRGRIALAALAPSLILLAAPTQQQAPLFVDYFGATQNHSIDDDGPGIQQALDAAAILGGDVTVTFGPGPYHLRTAASATHFLKLLNYAPDSLTLQGDSTEIHILEPDTNSFGLKGFLQARDCEDLTIADLAVDYRLDSGALDVPSTSTQGLIVGVTSTSLEVTIDSGYRTPIYNTPFSYGQSRIFDASGNLRGGAINRVFTFIEPLMNGNYKLHHGQIPADTTVPNSDKIALPNPQQGAIPALQFIRVTNAHIDGVTLNTAPGFGIHTVGCENIMVENVSVVPGPKPAAASNDRLFSINRDAIHLVASRGTVDVQTCQIRNNGDDAITIHSKVFTVDGVNLDGTVDLYSNVGDNANAPLHGDWLRLFDPLTPSSPQAQVTGTPSYLGSGIWQVALINPPPLSIGQDLQNLGDSADSIDVIGNTCEQINGRGAMVKSGNAVIAGNTTRYTYGPGISVLSVLDYPGKAEGGFANGITILSNTVEHPHAKEGKQDFFRGGISVYHRAGPPLYAAPDIFSNVLIRSNTIRRSHGTSLIVSNASNVTVANNTFDEPDVESPGQPMAGGNGVDINMLVDLERVDVINFTNNRITNYSGAPTGPFVSFSTSDVSNFTPAVPDRGFAVIP